MTRLVSGFCVIVVGLACASCKDTQACEQSRMEMSKTWKKVKETAGARAMPNPDEKLSEAQKQERKRVWSAIEEQAHLVEGSFKTSHITWPAADKGRGEIQKLYQNVPDKEDVLVVGFARMVDDANASYEDFKQKCK